MKKVYPVEPNQIANIRKSIHHETFGDRNEFLLLLLLNTALRISDALGITVGMVRDKEYLDIVEKKTGKHKHFPMNGFLKDTINEYTKDMEDDDFLFEARDKDKNGNSRAISRQQAHRIFKEATESIGIKNCAAHSWRKSYARGLYEKTKDLSLIMRLLNHSSEAMTLKYLHLTEERDNERIMDFSLF